MPTASNVGPPLAANLAGGILPPLAVSSGPGSRILNLVSVLGTPNIAAPYYVGFDAGGAGEAAADDTGNTDVNPFVDSSKVYFEFQFVTIGVAGDTCVGWRDPADNGNVALCLGFRWTGSAWYAGGSVSTSGAYNLLVGVSAPVDGTIVGYAVDLANLLAYMHVDGTWVSSATKGGAPEGGNGFLISNNAVDSPLWMGSKSTSLIGQFITATLCPAGYTSVT